MGWGSEAEEEARAGQDENTGILWGVETKPGKRQGVHRNTLKGHEDGDRDRYWGC